MPRSRLMELDHCGAVEIALRSGPPAILHATTILLACLLGLALLWSVFARVDLVIHGVGQVRSTDAEARVVCPASTWLEPRVVEVSAREGDSVSASDVVMRLSSVRLEAEIRRVGIALAADGDECARMQSLDRLAALQEETRTVKAQAELEDAREEIETLRTQRAAEAALADQEVLELERAATSLRQLVAAGISPRTELEARERELRHARERLRVAQLSVPEHKLDVLAESLRLLEREQTLGVEQRLLAITAKRADIETKQALLSELEAERTHAILVAPVSGVLVTRTAKAGEFLTPGSVAFAVAPRGALRIEAEIESDQIVLVAAGLPATVRLDAAGDGASPLKGRVAFVSQDAERSAAGRTVYRVFVELEDKPDPSRVRLGMTGSVRIRAGESSVLALLGRKTMR